MSFVTTHPVAIAAAAGDLRTIGIAMTAGNSAAAEPTTAVIAPACDEVSVLTTARFAAHAQRYQALSVRATSIHELFVATLAASAHSYEITEAANAAAAM